MLVINIARDFTRFPSGRFQRNGETSGEGFRDKFLEAPISRGEKVTVELDGTIGYGSSFLEEAFGGLVRKLGIKPSQLLSQLVLISDDPSLIEEITTYINDAGKRLG